MEPYNQSFNQSFSSNGTFIEEIPLFVTYLYMVVLLMVSIVVIIPAAMVINVIWWTAELHRKYYFFVANLLATDIITVIVRTAIRYFILILYLLDLNSDSDNFMIKYLVFPLFPLTALMTILLPITVAMERMIVIAFPYRHRSILTTKRVIGILVAMWGLSLILTITIAIIVPVDIVWTVGPAYHGSISPFFILCRLTATVCIIVANVFLLYKVVISNRKAKENEKLGNEEEANRFQKLVQLLCAQAKPTTTLLLVGGIDVIGNILLSFINIMIIRVVEPNVAIYLYHFFFYPLITALLLSHSLTYGLYMKKIRSRLPTCISFRRLV